MNPDAILALLILLILLLDAIGSNTWLWIGFSLFILSLCWPSIWASSIAKLTQSDIEKRGSGAPFG
jgi:hypothetical protein